MEKKIKVRYVPHQQIELPLHLFYKIPSAIKNLVGNRGEWWWRLKYIRIWIKL